jgi:1-phosphatidylinositol phosphodiesterase
MNLPGTHDTATWNYTAGTQASLFRYTGSDIYPSTFRRCQDRSLFYQLNNGVRVFDWRISYNPGNDTLGFYHAEALLAPATRLEDVLFGFYSWLDKHPSEALLISIKDESGPGRVNDAGFQQKLYNILNGNLARRYWVQTNGSLGTLGEARGKMTLLQRFTWKLLPNSPEYSNRFGIYLSPSSWTDNGPDIVLPYNNASNQIAYIEDFYEPNGASSAEESVTWKYNATVAHLKKAITLEKDQLFISFSSAELISFDPPVTPEIMALGDGFVSGVNQRLLPWLQSHKGERFGIIMLDFFDSVPGLVEAVIGI